MKSTTSRVYSLTHFLFFSCYFYILIITETKKDTDIELKTEPKDDCSEHNSSNEDHQDIISLDYPPAVEGMLNDIKAQQFLTVFFYTKISLCLTSLNCLLYVCLIGNTY